MSGFWVFVCGPSGAGKDSVITWASAALAGHRRICFARRLVTRGAPSAWDEPVDREQLQALASAGQLAWQWQAHGLAYGIHARHAAAVAGGRIVVVNGSREHAGTLAAGPGIRRVLVDAPADVLRVRLEARGREDSAAVARRISRNAGCAGPAADLVIRNDGALADAGAMLRNYLLELAG